MPISTGPGPSGGRRRDRAGLLFVLLATALVAPAGPSHAGTLSTPTQAAVPSAEGQADEAGRLEHLAGTIADLAARLSAIREDLAAMHAATGTSDPDPVRLAPERDQIPSALVSELEALRARTATERAAWQHAEAAMTGELTALRERVAAADAALAELRQDREMLVQHIGELDVLVRKARTRELVDALVETPATTIEPAPAPPAAPLMRVAPSAFAAEAPQARSGAPRDLVRAGSRLDLQAELALAQLRIAELTTALDSARLREQAIEAEAASLRSLTEAQIKRFMGHD